MSKKKVDITRRQSRKRITKTKARAKKDAPKKGKNVGKKY